MEKYVRKTFRLSYNYLVFIHTIAIPHIAFVFVMYYILMNVFVDFFGY